MAAHHQGWSDGIMPANVTPCLGGSVALSEIEQVQITLGQLIQIKFYGELQDPYSVRGSVWRPSVIHCNVVSVDGVYGGFNFTADPELSFHSGNGTTTLAVGDSLMFAGMQTIDQPSNQYYASPNYTVVAELSAGFKANTSLVWLMISVILVSFAVTL